MAVAASDAVFVAADQQGQLAVGFEADDSMENLNAGVFHAARPADVGGFVETGHELDDQGGLLGGRCFNERGEDGRVVAGAVEGLLHRDHGWVFGALLDEIDHWVVGIVGVVEQYVVQAEFIEDAGGPAAEAEGFGREGRKLQVGALDVSVEKHEAGEVYGTVATEDLVLVEFEVGAQALDDVGVGAGFDFEADGVPLAAVV